MEELYKDALRSDIETGRHAAALLADPLLLGAFEATEQAISDGWKRTEPGEVHVRERFYLMRLALGEVKDSIQKLVNDGQWAANQLAGFARHERSDE